MEKDKRGRFAYLKSIWRGDTFPSDHDKFNTICCAVGIVHVLLALFFALMGLFLICVVNCLSAYFYFVTMSVWLRNKKFYRFFVGAYVEIMLSSCLMTHLCGWEFGFMQYVIALCPVSFFMVYSLPGTKRSMTRPSLYAIGCMAVFAIARLIVGNHPPMYDGYSHTWIATALYIYNSFVTFLSITAFSILFSLEIHCQERELEKHNAILKDASSMDPLTGLLNRRSMGECLDIAVQNTKSTGELFTIIIGDIDNFKMVNDIHGHNVGDDVLKMVARTIKETLPDKSILCRWGGEEFLVLIRKPENEAIPDIEAVRYAITQVTTKVEKPDGYIDLGVTMTFGMSQYIHGFTIDQVISVADENLYKGKSNGKNRVVHSKTVI